MHTCAAVRSPPRALALCSWPSPGRRVQQPTRVSGLRRPCPTRRPRPLAWPTQDKTTTIWRCVPVRRRGGPLTPTLGRARVGLPSFSTRVCGCLRRVHAGDGTAPPAAGDCINAYSGVDGGEGGVEAGDAVRQPTPDIDEDGDGLQSAPTVDGTTEAPASQGKVFVGGLSWGTTEATMTEHFQAYGKLTDGACRGGRVGGTGPRPPAPLVDPCGTPPWPVPAVIVMRSRSNGGPRGFGFVTFEDAAVVPRVLHEVHVLDGRPVEVKPAVPKCGTHPFSTSPVYWCDVCPCPWVTGGRRQRRRPRSPPTAAQVR